MGLTLYGIGLCLLIGLAIALVCFCIVLFIVCELNDSNLEMRQHCTRMAKFYMAHKDFEMARHYLDETERLQKRFIRLPL